MHDGGEPALYVVLAGKVEVVKVVDGSQRWLGLRMSSAPCWSCLDFSYVVRGAT